MDIPSPYGVPHGGSMKHVPFPPGLETEMKRGSLKIIEDMRDFWYLAVNLKGICPL